MPKEEKQTRNFWIFILLLLIVSALAYLPLVTKFGYMNDDWYLMFDAHSQGPGFFQEVFRSDRPLRAFILGPLFSIFGLNPLYYNLSAYLFRFLGGIAFYWTLKMLWGERNFLTSTAAILFIIYPGFLSQPNAIDYQSQVIGLWAAILSIALTVKFFLEPRVGIKIVLASIVSILTWLYLGLVDYFFGFEIFRLAIIFLLVWRSRKAIPFWSKIFNTAISWLYFSPGMLGYLIWRLFIFETTRRATDVSFQVGQLFTSPLVGLWWLVYLIRDAFNVLLVAWGYPLYLLAFQLRLRDTLIGFVLAALVVLCVIGVLWKQDKDEIAKTGSKSGWVREEYWLGLVTLFGALIPIIMANRHVVFPDYSRYSLAASAGAVILIAAIFEKLSSRALRIATTGFFVFVAVTTHFANSVQVASETEVMQNFWWQVAWRAPDIKPGVTLVAEYPGVGISEDYLVWGPANLIYYPEKQEQAPIEIKLPAAVLTSDVVQDIMRQSGEESPARRGNVLTRDFSNILYLVQTSPDGCVRFMDGGAPELSSRDQYRTLLVAPYSRLENVVTEGPFASPPELVFGAEPEHGWCYYYQKAELARQQGNWDAIPALHNEAMKQGDYPNDSVEWLPFVQAYTILGNLDKLRELKKIIIADPYLTGVTCNVIISTIQKYPVAPDIQTFVQKSFCE